MDERFMMIEMQCARCHREYSYSLGGNESDCCPHCEAKPRRRQMSILEKLADSEHDRWSRWQRHLHDKCVKAGRPGSLVDRSLMIHSDDVERWERQMNTPYAELSEKEKDSDRKEAQHTLDILAEHEQPLVDVLFLALARRVKNSITAQGFRPADLLQSAIWEVMLDAYTTMDLGPVEFDVAAKLDELQEHLR